MQNASLNKKQAGNSSFHGSSTHIQSQNSNLKTNCFKKDII